MHMSLSASQECLGVQLLGHMVVCMFSLLRNCETAFQSSHIIFHSKQQNVRDPISLNPHQHVVVTVLIGV